MGNPFLDTYMKFLFLTSPGKGLPWGQRADMSADLCWSAHSYDARLGPFAVTWWMVGINCECGWLA